MSPSHRSSQESLNSVASSSSASSSSSAAGFSTSDPTFITTPTSSISPFTSSASPSSSSATGPSGSATSSTLVPGSFYQLMSKKECPDVYSQYSDVMDELDESKIVNHPVVLLEVREEFAYVLITSTLRGTQLPDYQKGKPGMTRVHMEHVPIYPQLAHHLTGERLYLADGGRLSKPSYIKFKKEHKVPVASLRPFDDLCTMRQLRFAPECWSDLLRIRKMNDADRQLVAPPTPSSSSNWRPSRGTSSSQGNPSLASLPPRTLTSSDPNRIRQSWRSTSDPGPSAPPLQQEDGELPRRTRSGKAAAMRGLWRRS